VALLLLNAAGAVAAAPRARRVCPAPQIILCVACLGASAHWAKTWAPFKTGTFQVYAMLQSVNLAIFASVTGALLSLFLLLAPRLTPSVAE
jgi:hypothetical protein